MLIGDKLKELRKVRKISITQLHQDTGISRSTITDIENNKERKPNTATLQKIADALNVSIDEFFKEDSTENSTSEVNEDVNSSEVIPEQFEDAAPARIYIKKHKIFASEGFNADRLTDKEILDFANALLEQMRLVSYKYKK